MGLSQHLAIGEADSIRVISSKRKRERVAVGEGSTQSLPQEYSQTAMGGGMSVR